MNANASKWERDMVATARRIHDPPSKHSSGCMIAAFTHPVGVARIIRRETAPKMNGRV